MKFVLEEDQESEWRVEGSLRSCINGAEVQGSHWAGLGSAEVIVSEPVLIGGMGVIGSELSSREHEGSSICAAYSSSIFVMCWPGITMRPISRLVMLTFTVALWDSVLF